MVISPPGVSALQDAILSKRCQESAIEARKQGRRTVSTKSGQMDRERCARWRIQPATTVPAAETIVRRTPAFTSCRVIAR